MRRRKFLGSLFVGGPALIPGLKLTGPISLGKSAGWMKETKEASSGLPGIVSDVAIQPVEKPAPLPPAYLSPDADLKLMAAWGLRHLIHNPRPALNYEPVFFIRPLHVPPAPEGHDPIVPGDTDCRMDWEFIFMREISGSREGLDVEKGLRQRILGYVGEDSLAWVTPGARLEGEVYAGKEVPQEKEAWPLEHQQDHPESF